MRNRLHVIPVTAARWLVWAALSGMLVWWLLRGSEIVAIRPYYRIRHSVPYIWNKFYEDLPDVGNATALDTIYWIAVAVMFAGVLGLIWLALAPDESSSEPSKDAGLPERTDELNSVAAAE